MVSGCSRQSPRTLWRYSIVRVGQAGEQHALDGLKHEVVRTGHRGPERLELEVLREHVVAGRRRRVAGVGAFERALGVGERVDVGAEHRVEDRVVQVGLDLDVPVAVQQEDLHAPMRSNSRS
jgi:hypothetical protein